MLKNEWLACIATMVFLATADPGQAQTVGQERSAFDRWLTIPANAQAFTNFEEFLRNEGVSGTVPNWTLTRTASSWKTCSAPPFEVAPAELWPRVAKTLRYVKSDVLPITGTLQAASGYRNAKLNLCAGGKPGGAHPGNWALDLVPDKVVDRETLIRSLCLAHRRGGKAHDAGLGFYSGLRFHIDTMRFRRWGSDGSGATSPCNKY